LSARSTLLATLGRCREALRRGLAPEVDSMLAQVMQVLEHRPRTRERLARLERLERQLAHLPPGERAAAIRERMGLSKTAYYRLRGACASPGSKRDSRLV
jgi:hypothetical protein